MDTPTSLLLVIVALAASTAFFFALWLGAEARARVWKDSNATLSTRLDALLSKPTTPQEVQP